MEEINEANLPSIIEERFDELKKIEKNVISLQEKSLDSQERAIELKNQGVGFFKKKQAIEDLQEVSVLLANNQVDSSSITNEIIKYQQKTYETMKYLFALGVSNLANNRAVTKFLKEKLKSSDISNNQFEKFQKEEIVNVLKELSAQQDVLKKIELLNDKVKEQNSIIHDLKISVNKYDSQFSEFEKMSNEQKQDIKDFKKYYGKPINQNKKATFILVMAILVLIISLVCLGFSIYFFSK